MNVNDTEVVGMNFDIVVNDLIQFSSCEQLFVLMDGVLFADQICFLLRCLQYDALLVGCWERW
jgi:Negative regulator of sigma E activity